MLACACVSLVLVFYGCILMMISDHGYNLGGHRLTSEKMNMYEHTLRIPLTIIGPGMSLH
eukprot:COSAG02_NODE_179_length_31090_cov_49.813785_4_plen_60_part_00